jgi:3-oxoacyl-[acyl-carrier-protein] synthase-3
MTLKPFTSVYVNATGAFYPGEPVDNAHIDDYIAPLNPGSARLKRRILAENGIQQRYYSVGRGGQTRYSAAHMAACAIRNCLTGAGDALSDIDLLCTGTSGGDATLPGFSNMVQGELTAPPMLTSSHSGVCAAGVAALQHAAMALDSGRAQHALVATSEVPSRLFKRSRFASRGYDIDFDAHFLRWMLSDAAGAWLVESAPRGDHPLRLLNLHLRSFSGDYPVCMQTGLAADGKSSITGRSPRRNKPAPMHYGKISACCPICSTWRYTNTCAWCRRAGTPAAASITFCVTTRRNVSPAWCVSCSTKPG